MLRCLKRGLLPLVAVSVALSLAGCPEWLEVDDPNDDTVDPNEPLAGVPMAGPVVLPNAPPTLGGKGPIIPSTPALRVPSAGYWTRVRLDVADLILPYSWIGEMHGEGLVTLRLEAVTRGVNDAGPGVPTLRAVIPIALPPGTDASALAGLTLGPEALSRATAAIQTTWNDTWILTLSRLSIEAVDEYVVKGSMEGTAKRGAKGRTTRTFEAGFVALRAAAVGR